MSVNYPFPPTLNQEYTLPSGVVMVCVEVNPPRWRPKPAPNQDIHLSGSIYRYAVTPAQITSDQVSFSASITSSVWRVSSDASRTVRGIAGGSNGREITLINVGINPVLIANNDNLALSINRILTYSGLDITLQTNQSVTLWYDSSSGRWRELV